MNRTKKMLMGRVLTKSTYLQKGIGLLELMLSLSILAALVMLGSMYFSTVSSNQRITLATNMIHDIYGAVKTFSSQNNPPSSGSLMKTLVDQGYLTNYYLTDPWGGPTQAEIGSGSGSSKTPMVTITLYSVPPSACEALVGRLNSTINTSLGESVSQCAKAAAKSGAAAKAQSVSNQGANSNSGSGPGPLANRAGNVIKGYINSVSVTYVLY